SPPGRPRSATDGLTLLTTRLGLPAGRRDAELLLDLGHDTGLGVEELLVYRGPAPEAVDREERLRLGEVEFGSHRGQDRPVALLAPHRLPGRGEQVRHE